MNLTLKWPVLGVVLALCLGALAFFMIHARSPKLPEGEAFDWTSLEDKQRVAVALNDTVTLKDFRAEVHIVSLRENFWGIARRFKVNIDTVYGLNPDLEDLVVTTNYPLVMVNQRGTLHQVKSGDDLASVAKLYSADPAEIRAANRIGLFGLRKGQLLFIPGGKPKQFNEKLANLFQRRSLLRSPLAGRTTSTMGTRADPFTGMTKHHNGIDLKAKLNELVGASAAGTVIFADWNGGFGKCVKIDHHNGYVTLYGHLNVITVKRGQNVKQHQIIGKAGSTGRSTGTHLHFTVFYKGKAKNPQEYIW